MNTGILTIMSDTAAVTEALPEELSFFEAIWNFLYTTYVNPPEYYEYLNLGAGGLTTVRIVIIGIFIGLILSLFASVFNKRVLGGVVRSIIKKEAFSPEKALNLEELGFESNALIRLAVRKSTTLRRVVRCREEEEFIAEQNARREEYRQKRLENKNLPRFKEQSYKINPYADTFYIPEEIRYMADVKFEKKGNTWASAILCSVLLAVGMFAVLGGLPSILNLLDSIAETVALNQNSNIL